MQFKPPRNPPINMHKRLAMGKTVATGANVVRIPGQTKR
jgi:hypothetical protein